MGPDPWGALRELALFAGGGGGILGGKLLGWRTIGACELDGYAREILFARMRDGSLDRFDIWDDIRTFDGTQDRQGRPWRADVVSGGFPCQDISAAGTGAGITGSRSSLWAHMARVIGEVRPKYAFVENSPLLTKRGLGVVLGDLAAMGFNAEWCVLSAQDVGAPHIRKRLWVLASHPDRDGVWDSEQLVSGGRVDIQDGGGAEPKHDGGQGALAHADRRRLQELGKPEPRGEQRARGDEPHGRRKWWPGRSPWETEPLVGRVAHGVARRVDRRVDRLRATGNGQVPQCAAAAWRVLWDRLEADA